jgi:hypothetical protein
MFGYNLVATTTRKRFTKWRDLCELAYQQLPACVVESEDHYNLLHQ